MLRTAPVTDSGGGGHIFQNLQAFQSCVSVYCKQVDRNRRTRRDQVDHGFTSGHILTVVQDTVAQKVNGLKHDGSLEDEVVAQ